MNGKGSTVAADPRATDAATAGEDLKLGERFFNRTWRFLKSVPALEYLPPPDRVEIAFAGRSNVGKSSLINALLRHRGLARTSNTPGRTQELNYFVAEGMLPEIYLVDMPGYGFAKAPKALVASWTALVKDYLKGRVTLARVFVLIDSRHGIKPVDKEILELLDAAGVTYEIVLTKVDKISSQALVKVRESAANATKRNPAAYPRTIATSSDTGAGIAELRAAIAELAVERGVRIPDR